MEFLKLAAERYSVRKFDSRPIPAELLEKVLQAGHLAPTAVNCQPQKIYVIQSPEALEKIRACTPCHYGAPCVMMVCYDSTLAWTRGFDGKCGGDIDAAIVTTHMILEADELGLGTCWVMFFEPDKVKKAFDLPDNIVPSCLLPIGYAAADAVPSDKHSSFRAPEEIVTYL